MVCIEKRPPFSSTLSVSEVEALPEAELVRLYWKIRENIRFEEGRLHQGNRISIITHNVVWDCRGGSSFPRGQTADPPYP